MVAVIGAPAVDELAEILGADVKAVELIGDIHEHLRALARLRVLEGDGVIVMRMTDIVKVLVDALADVDNADFRADLLGDDDGVGLGAGGGAEAGHSAGDDVRRGQPQLLDRHRADHDGKRGVHAAGDTDDAVVKSGVLHTLDKAGDLNVEHTLAVRGQIGLVRGQMRVLAVAAGQFGLDRLAAPDRFVILVGIEVKIVALAAGIDDVLDVELSDGHAVLALGRGKHLAVLGDHA